MVPLILCIIFICLGVISLSLFLIEKTKRYSVKAVILKTITSLFFIATCAVGLYEHHEHILPLFVILGLVCGLLGDISLDLKYIYREHDRPYTYAGFIMFGIGHILYIAGMLSEHYHGENPLYIIIPIIVGAVVSFITILLEKVMKLRYGEMKIISLIYGIVIFSMLGTALSLCILNQFKDTTLIMFFAGAVLFVISDLILSGTFFGQGKERPIDIISNGITYYMAQYVIAFSMFFII